MINTKVYSKDNLEVGEIQLSEDVFSVGIKPQLMHLAVRSHLAAVRSGTAEVKNRAKISGGGRKPWRQKGTGRARAGSGRSPLWRGGAITHGPQPRDYSFKINKKVRRLALKMALSSRLAQEKLKIVDDLDMPEVKTRQFVEMKGKLELKKPLIVTGKKYNNLELSARNVRGAQVVTHDSVNIYDILRHNELVMDKQAVEELQKRLS
ncbi:50S ribosomal protein L4 [Desulfonatronovibrio hydrogenovorans]|uniref:50S ribosomal protein L4 n=1 Tax=Desulfonatronovibrio hydrogenovorans TaxID=53245 RepID=UPI0004916BE7|nr:50S ribosomal protein L4 [Desulfonatronovibrio hydrogenovorans]